MLRDRLPHSQLDKRRRDIPSGLSERSKWINRGCPGDYVQTEVEERRYSEAYQGTTTNIGEPAKCLKQNVVCDVPSQARISLDIGNQQIKWRARMLSSLDISNCDLTHCVCSGHLQQNVTDWQEFSPGMVSFTVPQVYALAPGTIATSQIIGGQLVSGSLDQVAAEDNLGPRIRHTGPQNANAPAMQLSIHLGSDDIANVEIAVSTLASRTCSQTITALRPADQQWVVLNLQPVSTTEVRLKGLSLPGKPADYFVFHNGTSTLSIQVMCTPTSAKQVDFTVDYIAVNYSGGIFR